MTADRDRRNEGHGAEPDGGPTVAAPAGDSRADGPLGGTRADGADGSADGDAAAAAGDAVADEPAADGAGDPGDGPAEAGEPDPVERLRAELDERTGDLQRVSAEFANYRRRVERERDVERAAARAGVIRELLGLADDLDRAEEHGDLADGPLKAFGDKFRGILTGLRVESFGAEGDEFDPERHEAVQDASTGEDKALGAVLRKGYQVDGRLLRTAMVVIADPAPGDGDGDAAAD